MRYRLRAFPFLFAAAAVGGCAATDVPMTFGEIPRDGRGLPVWSVVMKKTPPGAIASGAGRADPAGSPADRP